MSRESARLKIIQAANRRKLRTGTSRLGMFSQRHLQRAVAVVRNNGMVKPAVLIEAGFNEHGPNYRPGRSQ